MSKKHRARAVLLTPGDTLLLIGRVRPGVAPYSVVVGGGVEEGDADPKAAAVREVYEEIHGRAEIVRHLHTLEDDKERQDFYLATVEEWSFDDKSGPEFTQEGRGEYTLLELPLTVAAIDAANLMPPEFAAVLRGLVEHDELVPVAQAVE
ncbi:NUDIX domain-containing protein [Kitasatospora phosalacinea]|uniref:DNA mismatch repair protein MutT n=1 Tax=Kitasatospora phosalacinea TaxID=2065 RepID=A0A9W6UR30_9ACTN|nr:NUDIX domain-containing protein [Kitasatospora phosalacinea]GLW57839.1 DNA mismatch repair protein MutT [Kitasatospora phosalacinea]